jgi:fibronectin type 3 domain-containing protein
VVSGATTTSSEFTVSGVSFPVTIAAGKTASISVKFTPNSSGTATGKLSFTANAASSPAVESLTGTGTGASQHGALLSWKAGSSSVSGYDVYRSTTSGGPYSKVNSSLDSSTSYSDATVQANETYYYVVTGVNSEGSQSGYSNQVEAVVP